MDDKLNRIRKLIEEYDYEGALALFDEVYKSRNFNKEFLKEYIDFLINYMGEYKKALEILEDNTKTVDSSLDLQKLFVKSLFFAEKFDECCNFVSKYSSILSDDPEIKLLYAKSLIFTQDYSRAKGVLLEILKGNPGNFEANQLLKKCDENLKESIDSLIDEIVRLKKDGNYKQALQKIEDGLKIDRTVSKLHQLKSEILKEIETEEIKKLKQEFESFYDKEEYEKSLEVLRKLEDFESEKGWVAREIKKIKEKINRKTFERFFAAAKELFEKGELRGAILKIYNIFQLPSYTEYLNEKNRDEFIEFFEFTNEYHMHNPQVDITKVADSIISLYQLKQKNVAMDDTLLSTLEKIRNAIGGFPFLNKWISDIKEELKKKEEFENQRVYDEALLLFKKGDLHNALEKFKVVSNFKDSKDYIEKIEKSLKQEEKLNLLFQEVERAIIKKEPIFARKKLEECKAICDDEEKIKKYETSISNLYDEVYNILPQIPVSSDELFEMYPLFEQKFVFTDDFDLIYLSSDNIVYYDYDKKKEQGIWQLNGAFGNEDDTIMLKGGKHNLFFILNKTISQLFLVRFEPSKRPEILDVFDLRKIYPPKTSEYTISFELTDDYSELLVLISHVKARVKPVLYSYSVNGFKLNFREEFPFNLFRLIKVKNRENLFGVSRMFVDSPNAPRPKYEFALINERAKIIKKFIFDSITEPVNSVRKMYYSEKADKYFFSYDYFDTVTGRMSEDSIGLGILTGELNVYFQESYMEDKLSERKFIAGDLCVNEDKEKVYLPWRDRDKNVGIAVFPYLDPSKPDEIKIGKGEFVTNLALYREKLLAFVRVKGKIKIIEVL